MSTATELAVEVINGNPAERILVLAGNYREFVYWCRENEINHRAVNVKCVLRHEQLRGYRDARYVFLDVPDGPEGLHLLRLFDHLKAMGWLKSARSIGSERKEEG